MNLRQIIDLNIRIKTIKLLEENTGKKIFVTLGKAKSSQIHYQKQDL